MKKTDPDQEFQRFAPLKVDFITSIQWDCRKTEEGPTTWAERLNHGTMEPNGDDTERKSNKFEETKEIWEDDASPLK